ncbi:hypothetical protein [Vibrio owensii]
MHDRKPYNLGWSLVVIAYILLAVLIGSPSISEKIKEVSIEGSSNTIAWLSAVAAGASAIATFLSFRVASSSRDIARNALAFQYQDSIKESISLIVSTLVSIKTNSISVNNMLTTQAVSYSLSTKRTDWIFAAQEVDNIVSLIEGMSLNEIHKKRLMERYGRILHNQLCPTTYGKKRVFLLLISLMILSWIESFLRSQRQLEMKICLRFICLQNNMNYMNLKVGNILSITVVVTFIKVVICNSRSFKYETQL